MPEEDERGRGKSFTFPRRTVLGGPGLGEQRFDELGIISGSRCSSELFRLAELRAVNGHLCLGDLSTGEKP